MIRLLTLCAILLLHLASVGQTTFNDSLLKEDYNIFKTIGSELSPKFNDADRAAFNAAFESRIGELTGKTMTVLEFVDFLSKSTAKSKLDGHGQLILPEKVISGLLDGGNALFPIPVIIIDSMVVVNSDVSDIPYGSLITGINGHAIETIISTLAKDHSTASLRNLETSFDIFYLIKYGVPEAFTVSYKTSQSAPIKTIAVLPIDVNSRNELYKKGIYPLNKDLLINTINTNYYKETDCYYLQLNSFGMINGKTENVYSAFNSELKTVFKAIAKQAPKNLIIDLRFNGGGDVEIPGLLYSFIAQQPFTEDISMVIPGFNFPYKNLITAIENKPIKDTTEVNTFIRETTKKLDFKNNHYEYSLVKNVKTAPQKTNFKGNVFLLIGGRSASASSYFTAMVKANDRGILVGEALGGTHRDLTAGKLIDYTLPNTKVIIRIPIATVNFSEDISAKIPQDIIQPDSTVDGASKYKAFLNKEDADLQAVFNLITSKTD